MANKQALKLFQLEASYSSSLYANWRHIRAFHMAVYCDAARGARRDEVISIRVASSLFLGPTRFPIM